MHCLNGIVRYRPLAGGLYRSTVTNIGKGMTAL
jgi:hypothetical protein